MRTIKVIIIFLTLFSPMILHSQEQILTLEDLIPGGKTYNKYRAEMPQSISWHGENLTFIKGDTMFISPRKENDRPKTYFTLEDINTEMGLTGKDRLIKLIYAQWFNPESNNLLVRTYNRSYIYDVETRTINATFKVDKNFENFDFSPAFNYVAYTKENNLYIQSHDGKEFAITNDTNKAILSGQAVHRNEFGIQKGTFWSPKGSLLAFYRMDETMVTDYPLVDISTRIATLVNEKYPMAGMKSHHVTIGVYNPTNDSTIFLKTGTPKDKYLTNIAWSPDEKYIYVAELNRGQDTCTLKSYDANTGKPITTVFTETHPKYVEPQVPILFLKKDTDKFIWQSRRDGYNHFYLYDTKGKLIKQLTSGKWEVVSTIGFDAKGENLYYISTEKSPIEKHIYALNLKSGKREQISIEEGVHEGYLSASGKYIADIYTSQNNPGKIATIETKPKKSVIWHTAKNPYINKQLPQITIGTLKANDGITDLYYRMVKPTDFDPQKKYPVIIYVYGGPHLQLIENRWMTGARGWDIFMAEKGYLIFTLDNRGTPYRGFEFENIIHRQLGVVETQDQMTGVEYLKSLPYIDSERIGVHGWSFGGFMTLNLMLRHPETFKVGVAGGAVTDWKYYEIMYGERYMDSPQENPTGYKETNMVDRAGDLKGRLMLIHGDEDPTVVMQHSLQFLKSSIKKGTHPDFFIYPGQGHNMMGRDRIHLHEHITRYFEDHLK